MRLRREPMDEQGKNTGYLLLSRAQHGRVEIRTLEEFFVLDTTGGARILRGADQAGHKIEVDMQSHPHQIVSFNLVAFIRRFLDFRFGNFEEDECFKD